MSSLYDESGKSESGPPREAVEAANAYIWDSGLQPLPS